MGLIGERLPDPYYEQVVHKAATTHVRNRKCLTCGHQFPTVEIPLAWKWAGSNPVFCPRHQSQKSVVTLEITIGMAKRGTFSSGGLLRVVTFGGVYRRRECGLNYERREGMDRRRPKAEPECLTDGKPTRWTTAELPSTGIINADVTRCPRCGNKSRAMRGKDPVPPGEKTKRRGGKR